MEPGKIIAVKREIVLMAPSQPSYNAVITHVEKDLFWVNLPREGGQVLMLQEKQRVKVLIPLLKDIYTAEATVEGIGSHDRFYGLSIPKEFTKTRERTFLRAYYSADVLFQTDDLVVRTALVNFSAGGVMVYLVPELEKVIQSNKRIIVKINIGIITLEAPVRLTWRKSYDSIPYAGFEFLDINPKLQEVIDELALIYYQEENRF